MTVFTRMDVPGDVAAAVARKPQDMVAIMGAMPKLPWDKGDKAQVPAVSGDSVPLRVLTTSAELDGAMVGRVYADDLEALGGVAPIVFSAEGLPPGLKVLSGGSLEGTPTSPGDFGFTVTVKDAEGTEISAQLRLQVDKPRPNFGAKPAPEKSAPTTPTSAKPTAKPAKAEPAKTEPAKSESAPAPEAEKKQVEPAKTEPAELVPATETAPAKADTQPAPKASSEAPGEVSPAPTDAGAAAP